MLSNCAWRVQIPSNTCLKISWYKCPPNTGSTLLIGVRQDRFWSFCHSDFAKFLWIGMNWLLSKHFHNQFPQKFPNFLNKILTSTRTIWHWNTNTNTKHPLQGQPKWQLSTNGSLNTHPIPFTNSNSLRCVVLYFREIYFRTVPIHCRKVATKYEDIKDVSLILKADLVHVTFGLKTQQLLLAEDKNSTIRNKRYCAGGGGGESFRIYRIYAMTDWTSQISISCIIRYAFCLKIHGWWGYSINSRQNHTNSGDDVVTLQLV